MKQILELRQQLSSRHGPEFLEDLIQLDINLSDALQRLLEFFVKAQLDGELSGGLRPEFLDDAFEILLDPGLPGFYENPEALVGDLFQLS